jgi:FKBP-type peptidyl-prolyl cis-trans isomerase FkpA
MRVSLFALALVSVLAACGGEESPAPSGGTSAAGESSAPDAREAAQPSQSPGATPPGSTAAAGGSDVEVTVITSGTGPSPTADDTVVVHYHGTFPDGRVFDSSRDRGQPARFPLRRVIPCWTKGLQQMHVGEKAKLVCPPELAYGPSGAPPTIPPNATLHFEVELLEIAP